MKVIFNNRLNEIDKNQIRNIKNNFIEGFEKIRNTLINSGYVGKIDFILFGEKKLVQDVFYVILISENIIGGLYIFQKNWESRFEHHIQNFIFDFKNSSNENFIFNFDWKTTFLEVQNRKNNNITNLLKILNEIESTNEIQNISIRLKRNQKLIQDFKSSFGNDKYCQICETKETFFMENNEKYFEVHHLIPYNTITVELFKNLNLDIYENLILLCSNCHRKLHFINSKDRIKILESLFVDKSKQEFYSNYVGLNSQPDYEDFIKLINSIYNLTFRLTERDEDDK